MKNLGNFAVSCSAYVLIDNIFMRSPLKHHSTCGQRILALNNQLTLCRIRIFIKLAVEPLAEKISLTITTHEDFGSTATSTCSFVSSTISEVDVKTLIQRLHFKR